MKPFVTILFAILVFNSYSQEKSDGTILLKKMKYAGLLVSYSKTEKLNSKSIIENVVSSYQKSSSIKFGGGYLINNKMAIGLGLSTGTNLINKEVKNTFGANTITDSKTTHWGFSPFIRNFMSLDKGHHFYIYTQTGLVFGFDNGTEISTTGTSSTNTSIKSNNYGISFTPGLLAFIKDGFAFELNVGVAGINSSKETRKVVGQPDAVVKQTDIDLNIDILKLNIGVSYYFK